jgi:pimeloyl-ACP methyl ester carboxylesterase
MRFGIAVLCAASALCQPFYDRVHPSKIFKGPRHYRIFLPPDYEISRKRYPVIYYFHGHSDRYTLEKYDNGKDTVPRISNFVAGHRVIVVAVDGYVARNYTGFYGGSPWDIQQKDVEYDFGEYFKELVTYIDSTYRTLTDRRHRATSGLSMGGFMSLWLSARYPDLIGSASSFNPGPEFFVGEQGRRVLWRPKDHVSSHEQVMIRLIRASGDYISQYTEETHLAFARAPKVNFEFRQDEYHRHWSTSIAETFAFHLRAFANSVLDNVPIEWSHSDAYTHFRVWNYDVSTAGPGPGVTYLQDVTQSGLRLTTRQWAPDGPPASRQITITTPSLYQPRATYTLLDRRLSGGEVKRRAVQADAGGHLIISADGSGHQISIAGPGSAAQSPVLLPVASGEALRVEPGAYVRLPIRVYNPRNTPMKNVTVSLSSEYATVELHQREARVAELGPGATADLSERLTAAFVAGAGYYAPARLSIALSCEACTTQSRDVDVLIAPSVMPRPIAIEILDGRTVTLPVFRQKGNQGGGSSIQRTITEGHGNGNGILEPGEEATIWVKLDQGLDPFDKSNWYRAKIYSDSPWLTEVEDLEEQKQLEWTSAKERTSVVRLSTDTPPGTTVPVVLDNESWSFWWTPDVRYGVEPLYQAFQFHGHHLHRYEIAIPQRRP